MTLKPTRLKRQMAILESGDYDTPEEMAKALEADREDARINDMTFIVVNQFDHADGPAYLGYGPYPTRNKAVGAVEKGHVAIPGMGKTAIIPVFTPARAAASFERATGEPDKYVRVQ